MTLQAWIQWAFKPSKGRHPFHSHALCRQAERDIGAPIDHDTFLAAMKAAGFRENSRYGSAIYFDCADTAEKRAYYRKRFLACDDRVAHPLAQ